ncbi:sulfatase-like hydrolase/transferase, partial [Helicobacter cinaedi]
YAIYSSDVSQFDISQTYQTLGALFGFFILSSFGLIYFTSFFYKTRLLKLGAWGVSVILCIGLVYTFVLVGDYGAMDHFVLQKPNFANHDLRIQKYVCFILAVCVSIIFCLLMTKWLKQIWGILFVTLFVMSSYYFIGIAHSLQDYAKYSHTQNIQDSNDMQPYEKELFSYSKTEKNIVVMVLDMFSGSHMHPLLEQFPEFKTNLDGFVLFDNAISTTNSTIHSIATLIGGEHYAVYNMNARKDNLADSITEAFGVIGDTFVKNGYDVGYFMADLSTRFDKAKTYNNNITLIQNARAYANYYYNSNPHIKERMSKQILAKKDGAKFLLLHTGLFRFAPELFFRSRIYNGGVWLLGDENLSNQQVALEFASSFYAFTHLHNTESKKPTFKYLHSLMTHFPYTLSFQNGECAPFTQDSIFDTYPHKDMMNYVVKEYERASFQHYDTEACALSYLSDFVQWLKENGIYDNTQIFVVSDHSGFDDIGIPYSVSQKGHRPVSLFLFKDFNTSGKLKLDSRLMANYDSPSMFCDNLPNGCPNVPKNILSNYPKNRNIISTIPIHLDISLHKKNEWLINHYFQVKGNVYDESSWQDITESVKNGTFKIDGIEH